MRQSNKWIGLAALLAASLMATAAPAQEEKQLAFAVNAASDF